MRTMALMPAKTYKARVVDGELEERLKGAGAVLVEGPKACGKTETARQLAASEVLLDVDQNARAAIAVNPALVLDGATPRLIDEWQVEPAIWDQGRRAGGGPGRRLHAPLGRGPDRPPADAPDVIDGGRDRQRRDLPHGIAGRLTRGSAREPGGGRGPGRGDRSWWLAGIPRQVAESRGGRRPGLPRRDRPHRHQSGGRSAPRSAPGRA